MRILVVDDEPTICTFVREVLAGDNHEVFVAFDGGEALRIGGQSRLDLVLCDVRLGEVDGFEVLDAFRKQLQTESEFVFMTGHASLEAALNAVKLGASDYICKPFSVSELRGLVAGAEERIHLKRQPSPSNTQVADIADRAAIIGRSPAMLSVFKTLGRVAPSDLPVLITGESGTGKELIARALHANSLRASKPFIAVNCGALTETLLETELFGHAKGAFTGASAPRRGLFEEAQGGTLLLDEVTETSPAFQVRLLRVLQEGEIRRVGTNQPVQVDVRILATTNQDVEKLVIGGAFRQDLMYRLNVVTINLPPLRERGDDIALMLETFLLRYSPPGRPAIRIAPDAKKALLAWPWTGNVREMRHTVQRLVTLANNGIIRLADLPAKMRSEATPLAEPPPSETVIPALLRPMNGSGLPPCFDEVEKRYVQHVLAYTGGNKKRAAEIMGVDRKTLSRMLERHRIEEGEAEP
jgi:DNA-binding NtrC family response regulator